MTVHAAGPTERARRRRQAQIAEALRDEIIRRECVDAVADVLAGLDMDEEQKQRVRESF